MVGKIGESLAERRLEGCSGNVQRNMLVGRRVGHARQVGSMGKGRNTHDMMKSEYNVVPNGERQHVPTCDTRRLPAKGVMDLVAFELGIK